MLTGNVNLEVAGTHRVFSISFSSNPNDSGQGLV